MARSKVPPFNVAPLDTSGLWTADYYDLIKQLDLLDPLSQIVFPTVTPTTIGGLGPGAFTLSYPLSQTSFALKAALTSVSAALVADVALNNISNYFDGPSIAQGSTGTWLVTASVQVTSGTQDNFDAKLWDGTTVIASGSCFTFSNTITLSGIITSPAGNMKMSVRDRSTTSGLVRFNGSSNSKDSTITAVRIA